MTVLTQTLSLLYSLQSADERALAQTLLSSRKAAWATGLRDVMRQHGCNGAPNAPSGGDLAELRRLSAEDAKSIAATWNRELSAEIERLYAANVRGNRQYYYSNLEKWATKRDQWKSAQIALNTETTTRQYARSQFYANNSFRGQRYRLTGPPPVCPVCSRHFGAGIVEQAYVDRAGLGAFHVGCTHEFQVVRPEKVNDCAELWTG